MFLLSDIVGKPAFDITDGKDFGTIKGLAVNQKLSRITAIVADKGCVSATSVFSVKDAVSLDGATSVAIEEEFVPNKEVFDTAGKKIGTMQDIGFLQDRIRKILLQDGSSISPSTVYACGDVLLVKAKLPKRKSNSRVKQKQVRMQNFTMRKCGDFSFLIGRVCDKNIVNFQGEVMIKCGEAVNRETVRMAKISGKLIELSLHTH